MVRKDEGSNGFATTVGDSERAGSRQDEMGLDKGASAPLRIFIENKEYWGILPGTIKVPLAVIHHCDRDLHVQESRVTSSITRDGGMTA